MLFKKKKSQEIYGDFLYEYRPTVSSLLKQYLEAKIAKERLVKESPKRDGAIFRPHEDILKSLPLKYIAVVKDNTVVEMIRVNEQTADILLDPSVSLVGFNPEEVVVQIGMICVDGNFVFRADIPEESSDFINSNTTFDEEISNEKD
jgi:hypothetical protein